MYPTSAAYKTAITKNVRDVKITGTITLKDATTINISDADVMQGSLYFTEQCVSGEDIEVGNVYVSEMGLTLTSPPANPYSLDGARVALEFGIDVSEDGSGLWEYVPLGYYYVSDIQRKHTAVNLKALDGMVLFDVDISAGVSTTETLRGFVVYCCMMTGVTLATSIAELDTLANATTEFTLPAESKVKTYRDLLMWACQIMGAFARMNREGQLEIIPVTSRGSVKTINKAERFTSDVSDFVIKITKVAMRIGEQEYYRGVDGMAMMLEENPLMAGMGEAQINAVLNNILAQVTLAEYVPFNVDFAGDPALQPGDYVTLKDTGVLGGGDVLSFVTHSSWKYRGGHNIVGAGRSGYLRGVQLQQEKAVSSILSIARAAQDVALAANQSTQLIKDAIGGHVLIRQSPDETNEILIMDHPDPDQATKIWRWNMGGLGYSDNVTGADNPDREYDIAMTMDGAINADFVKTGKLDTSVVQIGPETTFAEGYDPTDNHLYFQYSADGETSWHDTFNPATDKYMRQKVGDDGTWSDPMRVVGEDGRTPVKGADYFDGVDGTSAYLWVRYSQNSDGDPMTTDPTGAKYIGIATTTTASAPTDYTDYSWSLIKGTDGIPGEAGADGQTSYLHIKYSDDGETFTANGGETVGAWIGTYVDFVQEDSTTFSDYTWNKIRGEDGRTPVKGTDYFDGVDGQDGTSSYLWIKYSADADGTDFSDTPNTYMGVAVTTTPTAPTLKTAYRWTKVVGTDGIPGEVGADGQTSYLHIKYSDNGVNFTANNGEDVGAWIGTYVDFNPVDSTTFSDYTWNKVRGEDGYTPIKGVDYFDGVDGQDGTSAYLWVRYSQNANGNPMTTDPTGAVYIGIATTTTPTAPTSYTAYQWSLIKGQDGVPGEKGADGRTSYLHIKYSDDGVTFTANNGETPGAYIGTYVDFNPVDSTDFSDYTWNKVRGEDGKDGYTPIKGTDYFDGVDGLDGTSSYLWVRYSQNANGNPMTTDPTGAKYIGIATTTTASAPTDYTDYSWSLIKGSDGIPGEPGADGRTSYLHIKYSDDGETFTANGGETVGAWIGTYVDFVQEDSTDFEDYTWNKVKGEDGQDVRKFTSQPVPPYDVGDLWIGGSDGKNTLICVTARESGDFVASDWKPMTAPDVLKVDNRCKALFHFDGSINDHRGIMPTFTRNSKAYLSDGTEVDAGVARFEAGQFGQAVLVEEGTTNLIGADGDFENDSNSDGIADGWSGVLYGAVPSLVSDPWTGLKAQRITSTSGDTGVSRRIEKTIAITGGQTYTFSAYLKTDGVATGYLRIDTNGTTPVVISSALNSPTQYERHEVSFTAPADATQVIVRCYNNISRGQVGWVQWDGAQLEQKPYATSFTPGARSHETLTIPTAGVLNPQEGAVAFWFIPQSPYDYNQGSRHRRLFFAGTTTNSNFIHVSQYSTSEFVRILVGDGVGSYKIVSFTFSELGGMDFYDEPHFIAAAWSQSENMIYLRVDDQAKTDEYPSQAPPLTDTIYIGNNAGAEHANGLIDELAIFDYAPTDEEIQAWYEADAPFYALDLPKPELPGYVKIESDGLRVYDNTGKLRGVFGSWLKGLIRKYGIKIIDGEIYSTYYRTGKEGDNTYIELTPEGNFNAFRDGKRMILMQASAGEGRITLFTGDGDWDGLGLSASFDADNRPLAGVMGQGERGLHLKGGDHDVQMPYGSHPFKINSNDYLLIDASSGIQVTPYGGEVGVYGDFRVIGGNKNCIVFTEDYNARVLSCFEMPSAKFGDEGIAEVADGFCRVDIDPIFLQCLEPNTPETPFIVHLTPYDWLTLRVKEIGDSYFIVEEKDGLSGKFAWKLTGYRIGYGDIRLPEYDNPEILESGWEDEIKKAEKLEFVDEVKKLKAEAEKVKSELKDKKTYREKEKVRAEISKIINRIQQQKNNIEKIVSQETSGDTGGN